VHEPWKQAAILAAITLAVFFPTLSAEFVYDARLQIVTGDFIHDPWNWLPVLSFGVLGMDVLDFNRPVQLASLMLDAAVWGREPFGYHLTSVLLHAANVVMVWGVVSGLVRGVGTATQQAALLAAVLFAVHPVVTEAVCEPTFREDLLATAFSLGALLLAMRHDPTAAARAIGRDRWRAVGVAACCLLAVASKESGFAAPLLVAIYWWLFRRDEPQGFWQAAIGGGAVATAAFLAARFLLEPAQSVIFEAKPAYPGGSLAAAMLIEPRILALYTQLIALPLNLCADYGLYSVRHLPLPVALVLLAGLAAAAIWAVRADRRMALAIAMILLPLLPVANLIPIYRAAADRYLYFPLAGVAVALGLLLDAPWLAARPRLREGFRIGCMAAAVLLGMACMERQKVWATPLALWEDTYQKNPVAYTAASGLGEALREAGRLPEAEKATREAIRLSDEKRGDSWATLALILDGQGRDAEAKAALAKAIAIDPKLADPDARVQALAMERNIAEELKRLLKTAPLSGG
jgi:tetratricopeptide (TPR) repeat protein/predicted membrane protein